MACGGTSGAGRFVKLFADLVDGPFRLSSVTAAVTSIRCPISVMRRRRTPCPPARDRDERVRAARPEAGHTDLLQHRFELR